MDSIDLTQQFYNAVKFLDDNLLSLANEYGKEAVGYVVDQVKELFEKHFLAATVGAVTTTFVTYRGVRKAKKALHQRQLKGNIAIATTTHFRRRNEKNPVTGGRFVDQIIRPAVPDNDDEIGFDVSKMFHADIRKEMMRVLGEAKKKCTSDEPCVFLHIEKVVKPDDYENVMNMLSRSVSTYFGRGHEQYYVESLSLPDDVGIVEKSRLPLLVYEPEAHVQQWRLLIIDPDNFANKLCSDERDLRVEVVRGREPISDLNHHLNLRHNTLKKLSDNLRKHPELFSKFQYSIPIQGKYVCDTKHAPSRSL